SCTRGSGLFLPQHQIDHPAPANMLARLSAVVQDVGIVAAGIFEGVGEDGQAVEGSVVVDRLGQGDDVRCSAGGVESDRAEGVAEDVSDKGTLMKPNFLCKLSSGGCVSGITLSDRFLDWHCECQTFNVSRCRECRFDSSI